MKSALGFVAALFLSTLATGARAAEVIEDHDPVGATRGSGQTVIPLPTALGCSATYVSEKVAIKWFDTADGMQYLDFGDDDIFTFRMPFPFVYFDNVATDITVSSDGWVSFFEATTGAIDGTPDPFPDASAPKGAIAPFWSDLDPAAGSTVPDQRAAQVKTFGSAPRRILVVTWDRFPQHTDPGSEFTFQLALYETTNYIRFQYQTLNGDKSYSSVGIENEAGTFGYQYAYLADPKLEGKALQYRPSYSTDLVCAGATTLSCGARLTGQGMTGTDRVVLYGCDGLLRRASERVYSLTIDSVTLIDVRLTPSGGRQPLAYLLSECNLCNCLEGGSDHIRTVLGPGQYYLVVDGATALDSGPFDLNLDCESLLGAPTGNRMEIGDATCGVTLDLDRFGDGRGVISAQGWTPPNSDRNYTALKVDGTTVYATNIGRSSCTEFPRMTAWVDDNTDKAIAYWQAPEADIIQTILGRQTGGCCGAVLQTRVINRDTVRHDFEFRALYAFDFGAATGTCAPADSVEAGPLHVNPVALDYTVEQNLSCGGGGRCATECLTPAEFKSADDLQTKLIAQIPRDTTLSHIKAEWSRYFDLNRICDPVATPDPWTGGYLPTPDSNSTCVDRAGLLYSWSIPKAGGQLDPGSEETFTHLLGNGCRLDTGCSLCRATASLAATVTSLCTGVSTTLSAEGSRILDCRTGTPTYSWLRDGAPLGLSSARIDIVEPVPGRYTYTVVYSCEPPPGGSPCADERSIIIDVANCAACAIDAVASGPGAEWCVGGELILSAESSLVTSCPGTVSYEWRRDGSVVAFAEDALLGVNEPAPGSHTYDVRLTCSAPPAGLACTDLSPPLAVNWLAAIGVPADLGNTLYAVRRLDNVELTWADLLPGSFSTYEVLRGVSKLELPLPGPAVEEAGLTAATATDFGAISASATYYYRARGTGCPGEYGPY